MIPVNEPLLTGNEKKYINECIDTGWISSEGPFIKRFEEEMAAFTGRKHGVAVSSGTAALELVVRALGIGPGDEVILPTLTIISCASAIIKAGATPVLVDCDPQTFNMDPQQVKDKITLKTKAIMIVHLYGLPCDMAPLLEIARAHGLRIIEDAAEMLGQEYDGRRCGSFGDVSVLSFYANKVVTTGEGGMVLTDDERLARKCSLYRNLCFTEKRFVHEELGSNYRMTNLQAALGVAQLERLEQTVERKRWMGRLYNEGLEGVKGVRLPLEKTAYAVNIYWVYSVVLKDEVALDGNGFRMALGAKGIGTRPFFWCMHEQPVLTKMGLFKNERYPHAERAARRGIYLPSGLALTQEQISNVVRTVKEVLQ